MDILINSGLTVMAQPSQATNSANLLLLARMEILLRSPSHDRVWVPLKDWVKNKQDALYSQNQENAKQ